MEKNGKAKSDSHNISRRGVNQFKLIVDENDDTIFRTLSDTDYGIDGIIEFFQNENPTGKICYVQIKTTSKKIEKLKTKNGVSCPGISESNTYYCKQNIIPVILIYNSLEDKGSFYYLRLNSNIFPNSTIYISSDNYSRNILPIIDIIEKHYSKFKWFKIKGYYFCVN